LTGRRALGIGLFVALLVALAALWASRNLERVEEEVELGYRGPAKTNPYLAAQRLFTRLGVPTETGRAGTLPPSDHVLLLLGPRRPMTRDRSSETLGWVAGGGHVVLTAPGGDVADPLLQVLGLGVAASSGSGDEPVDAAAAGEPPAPVRVPLSPRLTDATGGALRTVASARGIFLVAKRHGLGTVTVLSDSEFLTNRAIGDEAHARVAWSLLALDGGKLPAGASIVFRDEMPSLLSLLLTHAWAAAVAGAALLALLSWQGAARFGPPVPDPPVDRRSLREHLDASAAWLFRRGQAATLVDAVRESLLHRLEVRQPAWARLSRKELVTRLAGPAGVPLARLDRALHEPVGADPHSFVTTVQTLEAVRRCL